MIKKSIGAVSFVVLMVAGQQASAAPVEYVMRGQITSGFTPGETTGEFVARIGDFVEFHFTGELDINNATETRINSDGDTVYTFEGPEYFAESFYDIGGSLVPVAVDGQINKVDTIFAQDIDLTGISVDGQTLNGVYDLVEFAFNTFDAANSFGYEGSLFLVGANDWLQTGVMPDLDDAQVLTAQMGNFNFGDSGLQDFARMDVQSFETSAVPVPAAGWLFMSGLAGVFYTKRSNKFTE